MENDQNVRVFPFDPNDANSATTIQIEDDQGILQTFYCNPKAQPVFALKHGLYRFNGEAFELVKEEIDE